MNQSMNDDQLRSLVHDAVSGVEPKDGLGAISARTTRRRTHDASTRWLPLTVAAATAVALVIGGTVWVARQTSETSQASGPSAPRHPTIGDGPAERNLNVPVLYVATTAAGPRLFTEYHEVLKTTDSPLQAAVTQAFTKDPEDPDYRNDLRDLDVTPKATESGGQITIDLSDALERPAGMSKEAAQMAVQAVIWTADTAASAGRAPVRFTVDGSPVSTVLGLDASQPVDPGNADSVMSTVSIGSPGEGQHVSTTFGVRGEAATFEANVVWELKQDGHVVRHGFTTATQCCTLSPYSFTVTAPPGEYTLVVHDVDESDGEGVGTSQDTKTVILQ